MTAILSEVLKYALRLEVKNFKYDMPIDSRHVPNGGELNLSRYPLKALVLAGINGYFQVVYNDGQVCVLSERLDHVPPVDFTWLKESSKDGMTQLYIGTVGPSPVRAVNICTVAYAPSCPLPLSPAASRMPDVAYFRT